MPDNRKKRSDSLLDKLTEEQQDIVFKKCEPATTSLESGVAWIKENFSIEISENRLGVWLSKIRKEKSFTTLLDTLREDSKFSEQVTKTVGDTTVLGDASAALLQQLVFGLLRQPEEKRDADKIAMLMGHVLKIRDQELKVRDLDLELEKFKNSVRSKLEAGLESLVAELKSNPKAMAIYKTLREELAKAA